MTQTGDSAWLSPRSAAAERAAGTTFDLSACVREPIHRLGGVQSHGALIAVRAGVIAVSSANAAERLGVAVAAGRPVTELIGAEPWAVLESLADADTGQTAMMPVQVADRTFDVTVHRSDDLVVLEFEAASAPAGGFGSFYGPIRQALLRLQRATTVAEACAAAVREIRAVTGFDRVVAYRFETVDGPGEVIAEEVGPPGEPWLGLWFPATDIPPQARRLYEQNWIRVIADVDDPTARLVPEVLPETGEPLDLTWSVLRTVSPFHLEYLRNLGVTSSMSVSLLAGERLWGLIACHGREPKPLGPHLRAACEFFGVALSLHLAALRDRDEAAARERSRAVIARLTEDLAADFADGWTRGSAALLSVIECDAVVVRTGGRTLVHGNDPGSDAIDRLWSTVPASGELWHSDRLGDDDPAIAGALVLPLGSAGEGVAWLRRERTVERRWAADPDTPVRLGPHGERLTPRGSTAVFLASVRGRSRPWSAGDLAMAVELGRAVTRIALANAHRLADLNIELSRSNVDLDSFAHAAAHDLKEPLRGIANTATFITEDAGDRLDEVTTRRLASIQRLAARMDELLNALLYYSRLGRTDLATEPIDVRAAVGRALEIAGPRLEEGGVTVHRPAEGDTLHADPVLFDEVLVNLLVNAAKYARPDGPREVTVGVSHDGHEPALFVRDNGIGMPSHLREQAFQLFRRLHPQAGPRDGSGAGLAIVRRIAERHGGQAWAGDSPDGGTTVWVTFPDDRRARQ